MKILELALIFFIALYIKFNKIGRDKKKIGPPGRIMPVLPVCYIH